MFKQSIPIVILSIVLIFCSLTSQAQKLSMADVKAKLAQLKKQSPHHKCTNQNDLKSCVDLIVGNDRDIYFDKIVADLSLSKRVKLSNYLIEYVLNNKEILTDERLTQNEKESLYALHKEKYQYGLVERIPKRLLEEVYSFNLKSSNFFRFISTPKYMRTAEYLSKSAMQEDNVKNEVFGKLIAKTYYKNLVNNISSLPAFFDRVLAKCPQCNRRGYFAKFYNLPAYGKKIDPLSPRTSIEYNYIFKPSIKAGWIDAKLSSRYQKVLLTRVQEIPHFIDNVLSKCADCNSEDTYRNLVHTNGFGNNARNFFESIEYKYVLRHFPYHEVVEKYFDYAVAYESDLPKFFDTVLAKCQSACSKQEYYKKALQLSSIDLNLNLERFSNRLIYQYVVKYLDYQVKAYSSEKEFSLLLSVAGHTFSTIFKGVCEYSHATSSRDSATFFQALRGASEAINHYDIYNCKLPQADIRRIETFTQVMNSQRDFSQIVTRTTWSRSQFTYDILIYPEPSQIAGGNYNEAPSSSDSYNATTKSSSMTSSTGRNKRGIAKIRSNGRVSGAPSFRVECTGGSDHIIYHKNGTWYHGSLGHMGNKYNSWSKEQVGASLCK